MAYRVLTRQRGGAFVVAYSSVTLTPAFDSAVGAALRDPTNTDVIIHDDAAMTPATRYMFIRQAGLGREPD